MIISVLKAPAKVVNHSLQNIHSLSNQIGQVDLLIAYKPKCKELTVYSPFTGLG